MATSIKWLHLSDFHVGTDNHGERQLFKSILEEIRSKLDAGFIPNFIFLTGDIAFSGQQSQYEVFANQFYLPLIDELGKDWDGRIFTVPGNHDVDRSQNETFKAQDVLQSFERFLDPTAEGVNLRKILFPRFTGFMEADLSDAGGKWIESQDGAFTKIVYLEGHRIGVLGLNTAWLSENGDRQKLSPGKEIIAEGLERIKDTDVRFVLGHHPMDWFIGKWVKPIRALFAKHNVIYLHGHLHGTESQYEEAAGHQFLVLQSGAAFQAREDDQWVNRLLWCELNFADNCIEVEPRQWVAKNQEWAIDGTAFSNKYQKPNAAHWILPLPWAHPSEIGSGSRRLPEKKIPSPPAGWVYVNREYLNHYRIDLSEERVLRYFDGWIPKWGEALSPYIPKRKIVKKLIDSLTGLQQKQELQVSLLLGAGGEGKSTAVRQVCSSLADSSEKWKIFWHDHPDSRLPVEFVLNLPPSDGTWLIVSDDADLIAEDVYEVVKTLRKAGRGDVQFLLSCRDTDWSAAMMRMRRPQWDASILSTEQIRGLVFDDAREIVRAWSRYSALGMGKLSNNKPNLSEAELDAAAQELVMQAQAESNMKDGALLGALLRTRFGEDLEKHVERLLQRLEKVPVKSGGTLLEAYKYIVALHAENFFILSKPVLANLLGCNAKELKSSILRPLGDEAAATNVSHFIITRHRAIAQKAKDILDRDFDVDFDDVYLDSLKAARYTLESGIYVPELRDWYHLSRHFYNQGNDLLGIQMTEFLHERQPEDVYFINQLAGMYRDAGLPGKSTKLYRDSSIEIPEKTSFFFEWSTSEKADGNIANAVWLAAVAMADLTAKEHVDAERAIYCLNALSADLKELSDKYNNPIFVQASGAAAQLGLRLPMTTKTAEGKRLIRENQKRGRAAIIEHENLITALKVLEEAIASAWKKTEGGIPDWVQEPANLTFDDIAEIIKI